jgi:hypothetical protein
MGLNSETGLMYVITERPSATYVIDTESNLLKSRLDLPYKPSHMKILQKLNQIILSYRDKPNIFSINLDSNETTKEYPMPILASFDVDTLENGIYAATATDFENIRGPSYDSDSTLYIFNNKDDYPYVQNNTVGLINFIALNPVSGKLYLSGSTFQIMDIPLNVTTVLDENTLVNPTQIALDTKKI